MLEKVNRYRCGIQTNRMVTIAIKGYKGYDRGLLLTHYPVVLGTIYNNIILKITKKSNIKNDTHLSNHIKLHK
jgi:hypothetical protein